MANAKQCDRCGKFYTSSTKYPVLHTQDGRNVREVTLMGTTGYLVDLCDGCIKSLTEWWENKEVDSVANN